MSNENSAERIVIMDFSTGNVFIKYVPMSLIEADADEIVRHFEEELDIKESDCQYMLLSSECDIYQD